MSGTNGQNQLKHSVVNGSSTSYSIPSETQNVFEAGILQNPLIASTLPEEISECASKVKFDGTDKPSLPINWRFAESISALKGLEAAMVNVLLKRKYNVQPQEAVINTDHAQLFFMSVLLNTIDPDGQKLDFASMHSPQGKSAYEKYFKNCDLHRQTASLYRASATNIYQCKDGRYFHLHGSMNPEPSQDSLGLPHDKDAANYEEAWKPYKEKMKEIESGEMQRLASDVHKQAGTICWTTEEFKNSEHGKANAHVGLYEIFDMKNDKQPACWWPDSQETSPRRPLAGLKVLDLTRIIAAPAMTRGLAELGASVMRVTCDKVTDMSSLHVDLSWGKWNSNLDFKNEEDREKLKGLIKEADVVVQGYRPDVLNKYGLSCDDLLAMTKDRERGLIVVRENCYGWNGPWWYRSGWQQISDACCGVSMEFGKAMGHNEPVTPVFPNSDFCTGTSGVIGVLNALLRRGKDGGSYRVDVALNYYSQWLVNSVGTYPESVWEDVWTQNGRQVFHAHHNMGFTIPRFLEMIKSNAADVLLKDDFFEVRRSEAIAVDIRCVKPIVQYTGGKVQLKYNVGTRGNGVDQPRWPEDLMTEIVK